MSWKDGAIPVSQLSASGGKSGHWMDDAIPISKINAPKEPSELQSALAGAAQGAFFGLPDEATAGLLGLGDYIKNMDPAHPLSGSKLDLKDYYGIRRDLIRKADEEKEKANPKAYIGGNVLGGVATALAPGLGLLNAGKGAGLVEVAAKGALGGGLYGAGDSKADLTKGQVADFAWDVTKNAAGGGALGAATHGLGSALSKGKDYIAENAPKALDKAGKIFANVPEDITQDYLKRAPEINASKTTLADLKGKTDDVLGAVQSDKEAAGVALRNAKEDLKRGLEGTDSSAVRSGILDGIKDLKQKVIDGSNESYEILDKMGPDASVSSAPVLASLQENLDKLAINGNAPIGDTAIKSQAAIKDLMDRVAGLGEQIPVKDAKKILQQLDHDTFYPEAAGAFGPAADEAKKSARRALNVELGEASPDYKNHMLGVAEDTRLLDGLSKDYGKESQIFSRLDGLQTPKGKALDQPRLDALQNKTGNDFKPELEKYLTAKYTLKDPQALRAAEGALPESAAYEAALNAADNIKGWSQMNSEARLKALMGNRNNIENKKVLEFISKKSGQDIGQELSNIRTKNAFTKADTNGSRKTLMGSLVGKAVGSAAGGALGYEASDSPTGALMGASAGFGADRYSGQIFKALLDAYRKGGPVAEAAFNKMGPFKETLMNAASRGASALMATTGILMNKDPKFKELVNNQAP